MGQLEKSFLGQFDRVHFVITLFGVQLEGCFAKAFNEISQLLLWRERLLVGFFVLIRHDASVTCDRSIDHFFDSDAAIPRQGNRCTEKSSFVQRHKHQHAC